MGCPGEGPKMPNEGRFYYRRIKKGESQVKKCHGRYEDFYFDYFIFEGKCWRKLVLETKKREKKKRITFLTGLYIFCVSLSSVWGSKE